MHALNSPHSFAGVLRIVIVFGGMTKFHVLIGASRIGEREN